MKTWFRNLIAFSLLFAYSLSISISIQNFIIDTVLNHNQHHDVAVNFLDFKTPELSIFPDLEPIRGTENESVFNFQSDKFKAHIRFFKQVELYTVNKDNQYLYKSKNIQPGLDIKTLLYPFHSFS